MPDTDAKLSQKTPVIWTTPQPIFDALNREFHFVIDLCADLGNAKVARYMPRETSLSNDWNGRGAAWLNPPYGRDIAPWLQKASETDRCIVACIPSRTNPPWWHDSVIGKADVVRFIRKKVSFANIAGKRGVPPWGVTIAIYRQKSLRRGSTICESWDWMRDD